MRNINNKQKYKEEGTGWREREREWRRPEDLSEELGETNKVFMLDQQGIVAAQS